MIKINKKFNKSLKLVLNLINLFIIILIMMYKKIIICNKYTKINLKINYFNKIMIKIIKSLKMINYR
jgi:hypothetical protein